jgi:hypothetical protein
VTRLLPLVAGTWLLAACGDPAPRRERPDPRPDKAGLFADPGLVPTREGERARRELARAAEIERALQVLPQVAHARVTVELAEDRPRGILVVVEAHDGVDAAELTSTARVMVDAVLGPGTGSDAEIIVASQPTPQEAPRRDTTPAWPLLVAILGLGVSLGITYERARQVLRRLRARQRRQPHSGQP